MEYMSLSFSYNFLHRLFYGTLFVIAGSAILYTTTTTTLHWIFILFVYLLQFFALREFFDLLKDGPLPVSSTTRKASYIASFLLYSLHGLFHLPLFPIAVGYLISLVFLLSLLRFSSIQHAIYDVAKGVLGAAYVTIPLLFSIDLAFFSTIPLMSGSALHASPPFWLLITLFAAKGSDMAAYFSGKIFGKHKLAPSLSPKKTIEGAIGGLIGSVFGFWAVFLSVQSIQTITDFCIYTGIALLIGIISQISDLIESLFKRDMNIKDSSSYIPGLGGILDIADSLIFTIPGVYCILSIFTKLTLV